MGIGGMEFGSGVTRSPGLVLVMLVISVNSVMSIISAL